MHFNKILISSFITLFLFFGIQKAQSQVFNPGMKFGVTTSNLMTEGIPTTGITTGFIAEYKLLKWFRLRHEANLLWHGTNKHAWRSDDVDYFALGLPVMVEFVPINNFYLGLGCELDFLTHTRGRSMPDNRFNFGLLAHIEYRIVDQLGIGFRYIHNVGNFENLRPIGHPGYDLDEPSIAFPRSSFQATLSYHFCR